MTGRRRGAARTTPALAVTVAAPAVVALAASGLAATPVLAGASLPLVAGPTDPRIAEASGLAVSSRDLDVAYVHNDSGDAPRFFAVDLSTGDTLATYTVDGADNVDWEDMAATRGPGGVPALWFADIGDNLAVRDTVQVYVVDEPAAHPADATLPARALTLRYPDGPRDAEALAVAPDGSRLWVVTKQLGGTRVYGAPVTFDGEPVALVDEGRIGPALVTGAAVSPDGRWVAVRTYLAAHLWPAADWPDGEPVTVGLPLQPQGESLAFRGADTLLAGSEGAGEPLAAVAVPPEVLTPDAPPVDGATDPAPGTSAGSPPAATPPTATPTASPASPDAAPPPPTSDPSPGRAALAAGAALVAVLVVAGVVATARRRR